VKRNVLRELRRGVDGPHIDYGLKISIEPKTVKKQHRGDEGAERGSVALIDVARSEEMVLSQTGVWLRPVASDVVAWSAAVLLFRGCERVEIVGGGRGVEEGAVCCEHCGEECGHDGKE
jgi:hypothetical protein